MALTSSCSPDSEEGMTDVHDQWESTHYYTLNPFESTGGLPHVGKQGGRMRHFCGSKRRDNAPHLDPKVGRMRPLFEPQGDFACSEKPHGHSLSVSTVNRSLRAKRVAIASFSGALNPGCQHLGTTNVGVRRMVNPKMGPCGHMRRKHGYSQ